MLVLGLVLAGALGAPARFLVDAAVQRRAGGDFPRGTFAVNVSGSLVLGFLTGLVLYHAFPATAGTVIGAGFLGAFTTFSTFAYEAVRLVEEGATRTAVQYAVGSTIVPTLAAAAGLALASLG